VKWGKFLGGNMQSHLAASNCNILKIA
jgi:hypothetical protein